MKNYSRQLDRFIESILFANSYFRAQDARTCVSYYIDSNRLIHSSSFNYSIIGAKAVTVEDFKAAMLKDSETTVILV